MSKDISIYSKLGVTVWSSVSSSINGSDETRGCKSLRLSHGRWIKDGPLRLCHIVRIRSNAWNAIRLILIKRSRCIFVGLNLSRYNSSDWRLRLNHFKMILWQRELRFIKSPRNHVQIGRFLIPWNRFEVYFLKIPFSPSSTINFLSDLMKFKDYVKKLLNSLWIRPVFTIIPLSSIHFHQIGKFGIIFDVIPREIDDLAVSSRQQSTALMKRIGSESLLLSRGHWIADQRLKWSHVACVIKRIKTLAIGSRSDDLDALFVGLISTVITPLDQRLRLKRIQWIRSRHIPPLT